MVPRAVMCWKCILWLEAVLWCRCVSIRSTQEASGVKSSRIVGQQPQPSFSLHANLHKDVVFSLFRKRSCHSSMSLALPNWGPLLLWEIPTSESDQYDQERSNVEVLLFYKLQLFCVVKYHRVFGRCLSAASDKRNLSPESDQWLHFINKNSLVPREACNRPGVVCIEMLLWMAARGDENPGS